MRPFQINRFSLYFLISVCVVSIVFLSVFRSESQEQAPLELMGGILHEPSVPSGMILAAADPFDLARFQRPSTQPALENPYTYIRFVGTRTESPLSLEGFQHPEDVILAFWGILQDAANMTDYSGGCGTVGHARLPYPYAYELLSDSRKNEMTSEQFMDSFQGIGHITLLKLYPAFLPSGTPQNIRYHMIEAEIITGAATDEPAGFFSGSHFAYFYGIVTTKQAENDGWKIHAIDFFPEDFLCAPMHGWSYDATSFVPIVYQDWYHVINEVERTEWNGDILSVFAAGADRPYRFDFVRIANGTDVLLHEMVNQDGVWVEINILKDADQVMKLSILNPNLQPGLT